jgi:hypothetical protein
MLLVNKQLLPIRNQFTSLFFIFYRDAKVVCSCFFIHERIYMAEISLRELWRESLAPFKNGNLKLYLLGALATGIRAIKALMLTFWWLLPLLACVVLISAYFLARFMQHVIMTTIMGSFLVIVGVISVVILWYLIILATRPSLEPKTRDYFKVYFRGWWSILLLMLLVPGSNLAGIVSVPLITTITLFFLDTDLSPDAFAASFVRGTKALVYFLPGFIAIFFTGMLCFLLGVTVSLGASWLANWLLTMLLGQASNGALILSSVITVGFITCVVVSMVVLFAASLTVYYVKMKHEHQDLFFAK